MNYYNDNDPFAAKWLRNLIAEGLIPEGDVDERSILETEPGDLAGYTQCHFFAGIAGWSMALHLAGWPAGRPVWTGSCPCQPLSVAGKGEGEKDERHLWPVFYRLIRECRPPAVFGEQVAAKLGREWLAGVRADLEAAGYAVGAADLCAAGVGAPHIRQRLFWCAEGVDNATSARFKSEGDRPEGETWDDARVRGPESRRPDGGLADASSGRRQLQQKVAWIDGKMEGEAEAVADACRNRYGSVGLGDTELLRRYQGDARDTRKTKGQARACGDEPDRSSCNSGLGDTDKPGLSAPEPETLSGSGRWGEGGATGESGSPWRESVLIPCADGKTRRVPLESAFFPLAHGLSAGRVGVLRGAGNAIVPQVAAEFIRAFMETGYAN